MELVIIFYIIVGLIRKLLSLRWAPNGALAQLTHQPFVDTLSQVFVESKDHQVAINVP